MNEAQAALTEYCKRFTTYVDGLGTTTFRLDQPYTVTMKDRRGHYRKEAMIGNEPFAPVAARLGKSDQIIYVFKPMNPGKYAFMEMDHEEAIKLLGGFKSFVENFRLISDDHKIEIIQKQAQELERKAHEEGIKKKFEGNPLFMSW